MLVKFMPSIVTEITHTTWHFVSAKLYFGALGWPPLATWHQIGVKYRILRCFDSRYLCEMPSKVRKCRYSTNKYIFERPS